MELHVSLPPGILTENCSEPTELLKNLRALIVQAGSFSEVTSRPVHARLAWFAVHAVPSSTCNIAVSQPKLVSELARTTVHSVACLQCDLASQRKSLRSNCSFNHIACSSTYMLQPRVKASNYSPSARLDLSGSRSIPLLVSIESQVRSHCSFAELLIIKATATIHNAIPALHGKWFRTIMSKDEYIVLVALDSAYTLVAIVPSALFPAKPTEGRLGVTLYPHGCLPAIGVPTVFSERMARWHKPE